ncbi:MAG: hypothetical protein ACE5IM_02475 [Nitrospinota bacterium]
MNAASHVVSSAVVGAAVGAATGSPETGAAFFFAGWAIDLDHILDFARKWGLREALARMSRLGLGRKNCIDTAYLILHGYEVSALLWALVVLVPDSPWLLGAAMGHLFHLLLDQAVNLRGWHPTYFLTYRALRRFSHAASFPERARMGSTALDRPAMRAHLPRDMAVHLAPERSSSSLRPGGRSLPH